MIKFISFSVKVLAIASYYVRFLTQSGKFSLIFHSPYNYAKVSKNIFYCALIVIVLNSCMPKNKQSIKLVKWNEGSISIADLKGLGIEENVIVTGHDKLKNNLLKKTYIKIFTENAKLNNLQRSQKFLNEYSDKENTILSNALLNKMVFNQIDISETEIKNYFYKNINDYSQSEQYDLYVHTVNCITIIKCNTSIKKQLVQSNFKTLSQNNKISPSGYFENIPINNFNERIQNEIISLEPQQISSPIKLNNDTFIYVLVDKVFVPEPPKLEMFKTNIKQKLISIKADELKYELRESILSLFPYLNIETDKELLANYAKFLKLENQPKIKKRLKRAYDLTLADYGYFASNFFNDLDMKSVKNTLTTLQIEKITRFNIQVIKKDITETNSHEIIHISKLLETNDTSSLIGIIEERKQITKQEYIEEFNAMSLIVNNLNLNEWSKGKVVNNQMWWINKTFQGLAQDESVLIDDYKKLKRFELGSYSEFMENVGSKYDVEINPIIYSDNWQEQAKVLLNAN